MHIRFAPLAPPATPHIVAGRLQGLNDRSARSPCERGLGPLAENGGYSTYLPMADSPVLQRGNTVLDRQYDQRGLGFPRVKGGLPDIGATEQ